MTATLEKLIKALQDLIQSAKKLAASNIIGKE